jgi:hypothetical protein
MRRFFLVFMFLMSFGMAGCNPRQPDPPPQPQPPQELPIDPDTQKPIS